MSESWLDITRGAAPLIVTFPHGGTDLASVAHRFTSGWAARRDADWYIDRLYAHAAALGATLVGTRISRSVIDVNRDPSGVSLYPGQATTELCPLTTFDGASLYVGPPPDGAEIAQRRSVWFDPFHRTLMNEIQRLRARHARVVLYDAHSIRSRVPRLFAGELPQFNIGTDNDRSCDPRLTGVVADTCAASGLSHVCNGRFRGGWITRHYGRPGDGVHAIQMELAMRGYLDEPLQPTPDNWPPIFDAERAAPMIGVLTQVLERCREFAQHGAV